ncbi:M20/M25/M40 family metallo-hydrolase [Nocardia sp. NPDC050406]|uniref:M20/M25/M40 family metallo-hydrolase n=1 Tax=Nocardia sp. NPDC050406 TaxID=3364318 RepID=UPI00379F738C
MRSGSRLSGVLAFVFLLAVAAAVAWDAQPRGYRDQAAPVAAFSAERALRTVEEIARQPHPVGSAEHARVRDHLAGELRRLGLETEVQEGIGRWPEALRRDGLGIGRVFNIVGRMPGTNSTGTVYLAAHYDSTHSGPGANDDGVGVASILETVRALKESGTTLRNDLVVLLTDGEEMGLLGAEAYVASGPDGKRSGVVVNHEARGAGGPVLLWRITHPDGKLMEAVARVPHPNTDSLSTSAGEAQTSSNTDFASLEPGGMQVLDWAYAGNSAYYHNVLDDPAHVHLPTVQQMGDNALSLARDYGNTDLATLSGGSDRAYFQLPFDVLIVVPVWVIIALAVAMVALFAWVVWRVRRNAETKLRTVVLAGFTYLLAVPLAMGAVYGLWEVLQTVRPEYRSLRFVDPYRPESFYVAILLVCATVLALWWVLARRLFDTTAAAVGLLGGLVLAATVMTAVAPVTAQILVVPGFFAVLAVAASMLVPSRWQLPVLTVLLIPAAVFVGGTSWAALQTGITGAPFLVAPVVMLLGGVLTVTLIRAWPRRGWAVPAVAFALTVAVAALGLAIDGFDADHPQPSQLIYAFDADRGEAQWLSPVEADRWTDGFVDDRAPTAQFAALWPKAVASGPAPTQPISAPVAEIVSDTTDAGQRTVKLRIKSTRGGTRLDLKFDSDIRALRVGGREITPVPSSGFQFFAPPVEGLEVELTAPAGPISLRLIDYTWLPDSGLGFYQPPPSDIYLRQNSMAAVFTTVRGL